MSSSLDTYGFTDTVFARVLNQGFSISSKIVCTFIPINYTYLVSLAEIFPFTGPKEEWRKRERGTETEYWL